MKTFKFKYSPVIWILLIIVLALSIVGLGWNVFSAVEFWGINTTKTISAVLTCALCAFLGFVSASIMLCGKYVVTKDAIVSYMGIIKSVFPLDEITEITHFKKSDKLVVYFKPDKFVVIVIDPSLYADFIASVRSQNPSIGYDCQIDGEDTPD